MEDNKMYESKEQKSNLSFFEPVKEHVPDASSTMKKNALILALGATAGLISALVAHMLANTISIMVWAFTENGLLYFFGLYGQVIVYTIVLFVICYKMVQKWDLPRVNKVTFIVSYFLLYILMFLFRVL